MKRTLHQLCAALLWLAPFTGLAVSEAPVSVRSVKGDGQTASLVVRIHAPASRLEIFSDGRVDYFDDYRKKSDAPQTSYISQEGIQYVINEFEAADFFSLKERYVDPHGRMRDGSIVEPIGSNMSGTEIYFSHAGRTKSVVYNVGAPARLASLKSRIEVIVGVPEQTPFAASQDSPSFHRLAQAQIEAFKGDPGSVALYSDRQIVLVAYRDGRVEFTGIPRLRSAPRLLGTYAYKVPVSQIDQLVREFDDKRFELLDYVGPKGIDQSGSSLYYRTHRGAIKIFHTAGPRRVPEEFHDIAKSMLRLSELSRYSCSSASKYAPCDKNYDVPPYVD